MKTCVQEGPYKVQKNNDDNNLLAVDIKSTYNKFSIYNNVWYILKQLYPLEYSNQVQLSVREVEKILTYHPVLQLLEVKYTYFKKRQCCSLLQRIYNPLYQQRKRKLHYLRSENSSILSQHRKIWTGSSLLYF